MTSGNAKKSAQLGMAHGTAQGRLRKRILFMLVQETGRDTCFQCGERIEVIDNLSIEHKVPWLDSDDPVGLFFDLDNIAFSHLRCNCAIAKRRKSLHGTKNRYDRGCRCDRCREASTSHRRKTRTNKKKRNTRK